MDWSLSVKSLESLTNEEECPMYTFKILVRYLAKLYVEVPQAETIGHKLKGKHRKDHQWVQLQYNQLLPTGNSSPPARFYGLPKIHKANCPMHPIVFVQLLIRPITKLYAILNSKYVAF